MDTANLTDDQVVANVCRVVVMSLARVKQVLEAAGWFDMRSENRAKVASVKPEQKTRRKKSAKKK